MSGESRSVCHPAYGVEYRSTSWPSMSTTYRYPELDIARSAPATNASSGPRLSATLRRSSSSRMCTTRSSNELRANSEPSGAGTTEAGMNAQPSDDGRIVSSCEPSGENFTILPPSLSAAYTDPSAATDTSETPTNRPSPMPDEPSARKNSPSGENACTRALP